MAYSAIFFDIDGTLVDSNDMHVLAWEEAFAGIDVRFERHEIHDQIGKGADMLIPALLPSAGEAEQKKLGDAQGAAFKARFLDRVSPFADAHALLARAAEAGQKVVLASSASQSQLDHYLNLLDARTIVTATTSADDVGNTKPAPDIFAIALQKVQPLEAGDVVVVGDTPYDIEAAAKCGIAAIGLRSGGFSDGVLNRAGAIALYDDAAALLRDYDASPLGALLRCEKNVTLPTSAVASHAQQLVRKAANDDFRETRLGRLVAASRLHQTDLTSELTRCRSVSWCRTWPAPL